MDQPLEAGEGGDKVMNFQPNLILFEAGGPIPHRLVPASLFGSSVRGWAGISHLNTQLLVYPCLPSIFSLGRQDNKLGLKV